MAPSLHLASAMTMTPNQLHDGLCALEAIYSIQHGGSTVRWRSRQRGVTEAILHELVHGICLGDPKLAGLLEEVLPEDGQARVDQELKTLRVECRVFELVACPISKNKARALFRAAQFD